MPESGDRGWLVKQSRATDQFVPFAFEVGGALGDEAEAFLRLAVKVAAHCRRGVGDLEHWSAMSWSGHWRQRIGVEIARGLARSVERAATGGGVGGARRGGGTRSGTRVAAERAEALSVVGARGLEG